MTMVGYRISLKQRLLHSVQISEINSGRDSFDTGVTELRLVVRVAPCNCERLTWELDIIKHTVFAYSICRGQNCGVSHLRSGDANVEHHVGIIVSLWSRQAARV